MSGVKATPEWLESLYKRGGARVWNASEPAKGKAPISKVDAKAEKELQAQCETLLRWRDIAALHLSYRAREKKGWPDLVFCIRIGGESWPCAVELKCATGKLSQDQRDMLTAMKANGWHTYVLRDYDTMIALLDGERPDEWGGE